MKILSGTIHTIPTELKKVLEQNSEALETWQDITPLARNEYICWITSVKKEETKNKRTLVAIDKLNRGERRPCCWPGCPHREKNRK